MKKHIYDEQNGLHYTLYGDYYLPDLVLPETEYLPLGKYSRMRKTYLMEHQKGLYCRMMMDGSLWQHLHAVDELAQSTVDTIIAGMEELDGVTEEFVLRDVVYI